MHFRFHTVNYLFIYCGFYRRGDTFESVNHCLEESKYVNKFIIDFDYQAFRQMKSFFRWFFLEFFFGIKFS